ncbi:MAG: WbqC family protein [Gallionella sp.]|nr:WbqC family protein [Gallionella sp.]
MKVALMQPYFFPYLGYFQLIAASDIFVLHDDVQYIKGGWVNRNRILLNGESRLITLPVQKDSHELPILARSYVQGDPSYKDIANLIKQAYYKAPCFQQAFTLINGILLYQNKNIAHFNANLIRSIANYLGIKSKILTSSELEKDNLLSGESRVLDICKRLGASNYLNPQGGQSLYDTSTFREAGIDLHFLFMRPVPYPQRTANFVPYLSIIDVLMELEPAAIQRYLTEFDLVSDTLGGQLS